MANQNEGMGRGLPRAGILAGWVSGEYESVDAVEQTELIDDPDWVTELKHTNKISLSAAIFITFAWANAVRNSATSTNN